ncbi:S41 family peptidase [Candidatus Omnitrophota bacterium]
MRRRIFSWMLAIAFIAIAARVAISALTPQKKEDVYKQLELFSYTLSIIESEYVKEIESQDLIYGALKGMLSSLDAHSQFLDPDIYSELKVDTEGQFGGLGIEITIRDGLLTVITPIDDTPAWDVGLKAGDKIVKIDDELTRDFTLLDAVKRLRGKPGTKVTVKVLREKEQKLLDFTITREIIKIKEVKEAKVLEDTIGYIRLASFSEQTANEMKRALEDLTNQGVDSLILDLRNNPGGLLDIAEQISELFLEPGMTVVSTQGRRVLQNSIYKANAKKTYLDWPIVVLVNEGSASGSEIVAAALQDNKRAIILGTKTFGKGSVQTVLPLGDGSALRLTTSEYFAPSGRTINKVGVTPDVIVEQGEIQLVKTETTMEELFDNIKEGKLPEKEDDEGEGEKEQIKPDLDSDYQVVRAKDLLKAIKVYNLQLKSVTN